MNAIHTMASRTRPATMGHGVHPERPSGRHVVAFFVLAYALTWAAWVPANLAERGSLDLPVPALALVIAGGFGPLLAAALMAARTGGRGAVRRLFGQLSPRGVAKRWFAASLLLLPLNLTPVAWHLLTGGEPPTTATVIGALVVLPAHFLLVALVGGGLDEEVGWRGYALPALLGHWSSPVVVNVGLGVVWALWHLPMWLDPTSAHAAYPIWLYVLSTVGLSVLTGCLYARSGGNLLVAVMAHAASNSADGARYQLLGEHGAELGAQLTLTAAVLAAAVVVVVATRGRLGADHLPDLAPRPPAGA